MLGIRNEGVFKGGRQEKTDGEGPVSKGGGVSSETRRGKGENNYDDPLFCDPSKYASLLFPMGYIGNRNRNELSNLIYIFHSICLCL